MAETKRLLPNWMLKQHTESKSRDSDSNPQLEEKSEDRNEIKPLKSKRGRKPAKLDEENIGESEEALQKCIRNKNNRAKRKNEAEIGKDGGKRSRKKKLKGDEIDGFSPKFSDDDDEIDLTVDDLVSIAEEYVNADEEKRRNQTSTSTKITDKNKSKSGSKSIQDSLSDPNLNFERTNQSNYEENIVQTNILCQDMLDLFLGPLLKKTGFNKEPRFEPTCSDGLFERSEREMYRGEKVDEPLEKKKSSLKDKVALFLD